jgi:hypothetical protein
MSAVTQKSPATLASTIWASAFADAHERDERAVADVDVLVRHQGRGHLQALRGAQNDLFDLAGHGITVDPDLE